jgi:hypothetical protein
MLARLACWLGIHSYAHSDTTAPVLICVDCNHIHIPKEHP